MKKFDLKSLFYVSAVALYGLYLKANYDLFKNYLTKTEKEDGERLQIRI